MRDIVRAQLASRLNPQLVDEILAAYQEAKRNFYLGGFRLNAVEGGRFCEGVFRILEQETSGSFTPLGRTLDTERLTVKLANLPASTYADSVRLHIPRALRMIYDVRNKRDAAHLADGIDPNLQDASLVTGTIDWVMAELVRLYHDVTPEDAKAIVDTIVTRHAPVVQEFGSFLKLLHPRLGAGDHCLVLLYHRGQAGASFSQLSEWVRPPMRANLTRTLKLLVEKKDLVHFDGIIYRITRLGEKEVEKRSLVEPA